MLKETILPITTFLKATNKEGCDLKKANIRKQELHTASAPTTTIPCKPVY
jgi:hypothetical protein